MSLIEKAAMKLDEKQSSEDKKDKTDSEIRKAEKERVNGDQSGLTARAESGDSLDSERYCQVDFKKLRAKGMLVPENSRSRIQEEFRVIKRPLLMNAEGRTAGQVDNGNLIMVTSALPGEGKTFNAICLALSIAAERDKTVLLVDADVIKPGVSKFFGVESNRGLVDYLCGEGDINELIFKTNLPNLTLLPAGSPHHLSTELLASSKMRDLMRELSERYHDRIVIFDSPPMLATTEANVLAGMMGQIAMIVEAEKTSQKDVKEAVDAMKIHTDIPIGLVLNKATRIRASKYYSYYYSVN